MTTRISGRYIRTPSAELLAALAHSRAQANTIVNVHPVQGSAGVSITGGALARGELEGRLREAGMHGEALEARLAAAALP